MYSFVWFEKCLKVISTVKLFSSQRWNYVVTYRSSHQMCSVKKSVLRNFEKFTGKHLCQSIFFNKVAGLSPRLSPATLLKKRLWHRCFPVNFAKFLRTPFLQNTSRRLLFIPNHVMFHHFDTIFMSCYCMPVKTRNTRQNPLWCTSKGKEQNLTFMTLIS